MKVLFTHSYFFHFDRKQLRQSKPYPPLATLVAAAWLRQHGHEVHFYDVHFEKSAASLDPVLKNIKPDVLVIYDDGFNYLTKMCLTNMREAAQEMIRLAKAHQVKSVISSSDSTDHYEDYLTQGADAVIMGEAEDSLLGWINCVDNGLPVNEVKGIAHKNNGSVTVNAKRPVRTHLDELPFAAWDLLNIEPYKKAWEKHGYFSINMATTRGCPFKCNWCAKPIYGNRYNTRSPQKVVEELALMKKLFSFDHIWFCDDIFGLKPGWVKEFTLETSKVDLSFRYKIQMRADLLLKDNTIKDLAESGCDEVWMGAESGSQKILDAMDKGTAVEQIFNATRLVKAAGMKPCLFLQFGYPGETKEDINLTLKMLFELMPHDIGISVSYPLPGTLFFENVRSQLEEKSNWSDSDELLLMYKGTYSAEYYKTLHRYVHKKFRASQTGKHSLKNILRYTYFTTTAFIEQKKLVSLQ